MKKTVQTAVVVFAVLSSNIAGNSAKGASIDWGAGAQTISGDSDVNTVGTLVGAFNLGPSDVGNTTVNGVLFSAFPFPPNFTQTSVSSGDFNISESPGILTSYNVLGSSLTPFSNLSTGYQTLLSSAGSSANPVTLTLTMNNLTIGQEYSFQWWVNNSSLTTGFNSGGFSTTASADNSVTLDDNTTDAMGGVGQFAIGTFTADDTQQTISFDSIISFGDPGVSAFQLRAVPEPSTWALMGIGCLAFIFRMRQKLAA